MRLGTAVHRGNPVTVDRYTTAARINHWLTAACLVLLALSGLALFHPSLFFLTGLFGGGENTRIVHPWIGVVMLVSFAGLFLRFWRLNLWERSDSEWLGRPREVLTGEEEKLPEVGKYNAGQKLYFWMMSVLIIVLFTSGIVIWQQYFAEYTDRRAEARRGAGAFDRRHRRHLRLDRARLCGDLGARHDQRHDPRPRHGRLGVAAPPPLAARAGGGQAGEVAAGRRSRHHVARAVREDDMKTGSPKPDPTAIGRIPVPPFARLPDPAELFAARAARFRRLAAGHDLGPYLEFLAAIAEAQAAVQDGLPPPEAPSPEAAARAARHAMPPLDRGASRRDRRSTRLLDRLLAALAPGEMPPEARAALARLQGASEAERAAMVSSVLMDAVPFEAVAEHALVAAALQVHFARLAAGLDAAALKPVADGACPACGGAPAASLVVAEPLAGARYCACALCGTLWNYVRAKCTLCGSTKEIAFREIEGRGAVKAEVCGVCRGYVKVLYQQQDPGLDPIADDVATLGLDLLVREQGFRRGAVNPFLTGY